MDLTITLPIRGYLKKFIAHSHEIYPLRVSTGRNNHITDYIYTILSTNNVEAGVSVKNKQINDTIDLEIPWALHQTGKYHFSYKHVIRIDRFVKSLFDNRLYDYLDESRDKRGDIKALILKFMDKYDLSEADITFENLKKNYYRHTAEKNRRAKKRKIM